MEGSGRGRGNQPLSPSYFNIAGLMSPPKDEAELEEQMEQHPTSSYRSGRDRRGVPFPQPEGWEQVGLKTFHVEPVLHQVPILKINELRKIEHHIYKAIPQLTEDLLLRPGISSITIPRLRDLRERARNVAVHSYRLFEEIQRRAAQRNNRIVYDLCRNNLKGQVDHIRSIARQVILNVNFFDRYQQTIMDNRRYVLMFGYLTIIENILQSWRSTLGITSFEFDVDRDAATALSYQMLPEITIPIVDDADQQPLAPTGKGSETPAGENLLLQNIPMLEVDDFELISEQVLEPIRGVSQLWLRRTEPMPLLQMQGLKLKAQHAAQEAYGFFVELQSLAIKHKNTELYNICQRRLRNQVEHVRNEARRTIAICNSGHQFSGRQFSLVYGYFQLVQQILQNWRDTLGVPNLATPTLTTKFTSYATLTVNDDALPLERMTPPKQQPAQPVQPTQAVQPAQPTQPATNPLYIPERAATEYRVPQVLPYMRIENLGSTNNRNFLQTYLNYGGFNLSPENTNRRATPVEIKKLASKVQNTLDLLEFVSRMPSVPQSRNVYRDLRRAVTELMNMTFYPQSTDNWNGDQYLLRWIYMELIEKFLLQKIAESQ